MSSGKTLHPHCLVLVKPRKPSQNNSQIDDRDVKTQTNKQTNKTLVYIFTSDGSVSFKESVKLINLPLAVSLPDDRLRKFRLSMNRGTVELHISLLAQ